MVELLHAEMARAHRRHRRGHRADEGAHDARSKTNPGNFFEDFRLGQVLQHATPRTVTAGDAALYTGLNGPRFAVQVSDEFAQADRLAAAPLDDLLVFHIVFGKTVPDISLNAIANLGYAECRFGAPVYPGDTLSAASEVIGLQGELEPRTGVVYVRTSGRNQRGERVLEYVRWVMVRKRDKAAAAPAPVVPKLAERGARRPRPAGRRSMAPLRFRPRRLAASLRATTRSARRSTTSTA